MSKNGIHLIIPTRLMTETKMVVCDDCDQEGPERKVEKCINEKRAAALGTLMMGKMKTNLHVLK